MNRRELIVGGIAGGIAGLALADKARAEKPTPAPGAGLLAAATRCEQAARACLQHCITMLSSGNTALGPCARAVSDLLPAVNALVALAANASKNLSSFAKATGEIVKDCKAECDKHPTMPPCKACADACGALLAEIAKV
jgi:Cys-rich four helix bundle protein (predicted Tat secretion target)